MAKGVYIYKNGWKNANDNLDIRGNYGGANTINGSTPTVSNVPKVFTYLANGTWEQIYPAKELPSGRIKYTARRLNYYQYHQLAKTACAGPSKSGSSRVSRGVISWGWSNKNISSQGFYEQDYNAKVGGSDLTYVHMQYAGWLDMGSEALKSLPNHKKVKEITYLKFILNRRTNTGWTSKDMNLDLCLSTVDNCGYLKDKSQNPFLNKIGDYVSVGTIPGGAGNREVVIDLSSSKGKACAELFKKWMRGEAKSIIQINNETCQDKYLPSGWSSLCSASRNYTKVNSFAFEIEYTTEG